MCMLVADRVPRAVDFTLVIKNAKPYDADLERCELNAGRRRCAGDVAVAVRRAY
jgi:hypothetical protein